jgi:hypothetical protein
MRIIAFILLLAGSASTSFAQTAPVVSNVRASQGTDGSRLVEITRCATAVSAMRFLDPTTEGTPHHAVSTFWVVLSGDGRLSWSEQGDLP